MTRFSGEPTVNPDATLVGRLAAREMDAAAELYDRYAPQVYALARRIVGNDGDAEDVVQAYFHRPGARPPATTGNAAASSAGC